MQKDVSSSQQRLSTPWVCISHVSRTLWLTTMGPLPVCSPSLSKYAHGFLCPKNTIWSFALFTHPNLLILSRLSSWRKIFCLYHLTSHLKSQPAYGLVSPIHFMETASSKSPKIKAIGFALILLDFSAAFEPTQQALLKMISCSFCKMLLLPPLASYVDFSSTCPLNVKIPSSLLVFLHLSYVLISYWMATVIS